ncbi:hypothetical protein [Nonomuraea ceibae]|nr:hypothetical protein [Nonomuraea ceibae]
MTVSTSPAVPRRCEERLATRPVTIGQVVTVTAKRRSIAKAT